MPMLFSQNQDRILIFSSPWTDLGFPNSEILAGSWLVTTQCFGAVLPRLGFQNTETAALIRPRKPLPKVDVEAPWFQMMTGLVICLNGIVLGLELRRTPV